MASKLDKRWIETLLIHRDYHSLMQCPYTVSARFSKIPPFLSNSNENCKHFLALQQEKMFYKLCQGTKTVSKVNKFCDNNTTYTSSELKLWNMFYKSFRGIFFETFHHAPVFSGMIAKMLVLLRRYNSHLFCIFRD